MKEQIEWFFQELLKEVVSWMFSVSNIFWALFVVGFVCFLLFFWLLFSNQIFLDSDLLTEGIGQLCFSSDVLVLQVCLQDVSVH